MGADGIAGMQWDDLREQQYNCEVLSTGDLLREIPKNCQLL
jgi:hypothetical protein